MDGRRRRKALEIYDLGIGFFAFFAVAFVAVSLFLQVTGRDAVWASAPAILGIGAAVLTFVMKRRFIRRVDAEDAS